MASACFVERISLQHTPLHPFVQYRFQHLKVIIDRSVTPFLSMHCLGLLPVISEVLNELAIRSLPVTGVRLWSPPMMVSPSHSFQTSPNTYQWFALNFHVLFLLSSNFL